MGVRVLFEASSVGGLAGRVESRVGSVARVALVARARPERVPLSLAQQRMWFLNRFDPGSAAYNIAGGGAVVGWVGCGGVGSAVA